MAIYIIMLEREHVRCGRRRARDVFNCERIGAAIARAPRVCVCVRILEQVRTRRVRAMLQFICDA